MGKLILTGVDGNLGGQAADYLLEIAKPEDLIFTGYNPQSLENMLQKAWKPESRTSTIARDWKRRSKAAT